MNRRHHPAALLPAGRGRAEPGGPAELLVEHGVFDTTLDPAAGDVGTGRRVHVLMAIDARSGRLVARETHARIDADGGVLARFIERVVAEARAGGQPGGQARTGAEAWAVPVRVALDFGHGATSRAVGEACASLGVDLVFRLRPPRWKDALELAFPRGQRENG